MFLSFFITNSSRLSGMECLYGKFSSRLGEISASAAGVPLLSRLGEIPPSRNENFPYKHSTFKPRPRLSNLVFDFQTSTSTFKPRLSTSTFKPRLSTSTFKPRLSGVDFQTSTFKPQSRPSDLIKNYRPISAGSAGDAKNCLVSKSCPNMSCISL